MSSHITTQGPGLTGPTTPELGLTPNAWTIDSDLDSTYIPSWTLGAFKDVSHSGLFLFLSLSLSLPLPLSLSLSLCIHSTYIPSWTLGAFKNVSHSGMFLFLSLSLSLSLTPSLSLPPSFSLHTLNLHLPHRPYARQKMFFIPLCLPPSLVCFSLSVSTFLSPPLSP